MSIGVLQSKGFAILLACTREMCGGGGQGTSNPNMPLLLAPNGRYAASGFGSPLHPCLTPASHFFTAPHSSLTGVSTTYRARLLRFLHPPLLHTFPLFSHL